MFAVYCVFTDNPLIVVVGASLKVWLAKFASLEEVNAVSLVVTPLVAVDLVDAEREVVEISGCAPNGDHVADASVLDRQYAWLWSTQ